MEAWVYWVCLISICVLAVMIQGVTASISIRKEFNSLTLQYMSILDEAYDFANSIDIVPYGRFELLMEKADVVVDGMNKLSAKCYRNMYKKQAVQLSVQANNLNTVMTTFAEIMYDKVKG